MTVTQQTLFNYTNEILFEKLDKILNVAYYSSQSGIRCCNILFIEDELLRKKIKPFANDNINITEALHLLLFYTWDKFPLSFTNQLNTINASTETENNNILTGEIDKHTTHSNFGLNVQNTYQTMDVVLKIAAIENIGACLIEDLHYDEIDELLELKQNGLRSVAFLALDIK